MALSGDSLNSRLSSPDFIEFSTGLDDIDIPGYHQDREKLLIMVKVIKYQVFKQLVFVYQ
jgi:hypothetical protein